MVCRLPWHVETVFIMDRVISEKVVHKRRQKLFVRVVVIATVIGLAISVTIHFLTPRISLNHILVSIADQGQVENSFVTNGLVEPFYQEVLTSSLAADILQIKFAPGDMVSCNDTIFIPDVSQLLNEIETYEKEIAFKRNRMQRSLEELQQKRAHLQSQLRMDSIRKDHLKALLEKEKNIFDIGGGSRQKVEQAQIDFQLASIDIENQISEFESSKRLQQLDLESMEMELQIKDQERNKLLLNLSKAYVQPRISGVMTSLLIEPGQHVSEGQALAHIADATRFKVEGSVSSRYADKIFIGQQALVVVNDSVLYGQLSAISPSVDQGSIRYTVMLDDDENTLLRAKLQIEVRLIVSIRPQTIRIANGDYYFGPGNGELFVKKGNVLEKRQVKFGGASFDFVEVISGIQAGETVVISQSFNEEYKRYNSLTCVD